MKLRNLALVFAIVLAAPLVKTDDVQAGGDMSAGEPGARAEVRRPPYPREQYRDPYPYPREQYRAPYSRGRYRDPYPRERYRPPYEYGYGYAYEYGNERTYVLGSYYRPYRTQYYSYSYATPRPARRDPLRSLQGLFLSLLILGRL